MREPSGRASASGDQLRHGDGPAVAGNRGHDPVPSGRLGGVEHLVGDRQQPGRVTAVGGADSDAGARGDSDVLTVEQVPDGGDLTADLPGAPDRLLRRERPCPWSAVPATGSARPRERPSPWSAAPEEPLGYWASMSSVTTDSVSGMPRSLARLSAMASSRRIRPATASLVIGGSARWPSSSSDA